MFYYLYEIRNNLNGKIYVGVHKTKDLNDGYMGSGKIIRAAIAKHGAENFTKTILEHFESKEEMYSREKEVVTEEFLARDDTYNLRRGGTGGFDWINKITSSAQKSKAGKIGGKNSTANSKIKRMRLDPIYNEWYMHRVGRGKLTIEASQRGRDVALSLESRKKRKQTLSKINHQKGMKNSQYGTCWIFHDLIGNRKCNKILLDQYIEQGWIMGRVLRK